MTTTLDRAPGPLRAALRSRFGGLPRPFWIVFAGTVANRMGDMVVPFLVFFLGSRGLSPAQTGVVAVSLGVGGIGGSALGGWLADRLSHRIALVIGLTSTPASLGALFAAPSLPLLAASALLLGITGKIYFPAANALMSASVSDTERPRAMSLSPWAVNIGTAAAAASAGFLAERGYWILFVVDGATCLAFAAIAWFGIAEAPRVARTTASTGYGVVWRDRLMVAYTLLTIVSVAVYSMTEFALPLAVRDDGLPPTVFGLVAVVNALIVVLAQPVLYGRLSRLPRTALLAGASAVVTVGIAATGLAHHPWQYAVATVVWSLGEVGASVVAYGIVADLAPPEARGRYQGAFAWSWAVSRLLAPTAATAVLATAGAAALWWGVLAAGLGSAALTGGLAGRLAERTGRR